MRKNAVNSEKAKSYGSKGLKFTRDELVDLHWIQGLSLKEIGERHDVTSSAIVYWMRKFGIEHRSRLQDVLFEPSPTLSYVMGVLHGDGFLYFNPANSQHLIILSVVDREFAISFAKALNRLGLRAPIRILPPRQESYQQQYRVGATSKNFHELWNHLSVEERLDLGMAYERDFIRGVYESDGCVKSHRGSLELAIYKTDITMLERVEGSMSKRGFSVKIYDKRLDSGKTLRTINLYRSLEVRRFMAWISPCIKYLPRGYANSEPIWNGDIPAGVETTKDDFRVVK